MTRILTALARRPDALARRTAPPDPARATMRTFVRTLSRLAAPRTTVRPDASEAVR
ncbi:MAG: hypothetical protein ACFE0R_12095 [Salinarimonas sp.]